MQRNREYFSGAETVMTSHDVTYVHPFSVSAATDVRLTGGKGATLARLFQAGLPVPPGCVLSTQALTAYVRLLRLPTTAIPEDMPQHIRAGAPPAAMRQALHTMLSQLTPAPTGWAVRSSAVAEDSATASFAGVYTTFLDVQADALWPAIQACWASWWSALALAYRQRLGDTEAEPRMAVVIQAMVPAHCAGVAFTAEPMHGDRSRMVINAAAGLGITVVSGVVEPEQYLLAKVPQVHVLETRLLRPDAAPLLPSEVVVQLGELCQRIERLCGSPQDIEWAWDGTQCWIVQSRPITTLASSTTDAAETMWTNANLKDVMPGLVSPFTWSLMQPQLEEGVRAQYAQMGFRVPPECQVIRRFWGRPYFNMSLFQQAAYTLYGATPDKQIMQLGGAAVQGFTPPGPPSRWQRLRWLGNILRFGRLADRVRQAAPASFAAVEQHWRALLPQIPHLDRTGLLQQFDTFSSVTQPFLLQHLYLTTAMSGNFSHLRDLLARLDASTSSGLVAELTTGLGDVSSAEQSYRLWELSRLAQRSPKVMAFLHTRQWHTWPEALADTPFLTAWQAFLDTYGHRCLYEVEMANPRWREQPDYLFEVLAAYATLAQTTAPFDPQVQARRRQAAERDIIPQAAFWWRPWLRIVLRRTQAYSRLRENSKSHLVRLIDIGRALALRAGQYLVDDALLSEPEAVFLLEIDEVKAALRGETPPEAIARVLRQRRLERQRYAALQPPGAFVGERPVYEQPLVEQGTVLRGLPSSPGRVTGTARVVRLPQDGARLQAGEVLVAPSTDPGWTPLFLLAAGLVMETGGYLSHGAIVAREYGIPAVLNVPLATQCIPDGSTVVLDGGAGTVQIMPPSGPEIPPR
jgi:pyruvate,water dikinase